MATHIEEKKETSQEMLVITQIFRKAKAAATAMHTLSFQIRLQIVRGHPIQEFPIRSQWIN